MRTSQLAQVVLLPAMMCICVSTSALAKFVPDVRKTFEIRLVVPEVGRPFLQGGFSPMYGLTQVVDSGVVYLSCYEGRIDIFRLNMILRLGIAEHFADGERFFVGLRNSKKVKNNVFGSAPTDAIDKPPAEFEYTAYVRGFAEAVREFDLYGVSELSQLYISTYPDAAFFEHFKNSDRLQLISYDSESRQFFTLLEYQYHLPEQTSDAFIRACIDM